MSASVVFDGKFDENSLGRRLNLHPSKVYGVTFVLFVDIRVYHPISVVSFRRELEPWDGLWWIGRGI